MQEMKLKENIAGNRMNFSDRYSRSSNISLTWLYSVQKKAPEQLQVLMKLISVKVGENLNTILELGDKVIIDSNTTTFRKSGLLRILLIGSGSRLTI